MAIAITEKDILDARDYVPLTEKLGIVELIAPICVREKKQIPTDMPIPPIYEEHRILRQLFLMGIFADCYLQKDYSRQEITMPNRDGSEKTVDLRYCMEVSEYDRWAESHVFNQMERLKRSQNKEVANRVFDILADYKQIEAMLYSAVKDELEERNDLLRRATKMIELGASPEYLEGLKTQLRELQEKAVEENGAGLLAGA